MDANIGYSVAHLHACQRYRPPNHDLPAGRHDYPGPS